MCQSRQLISHWNMSAFRWLAQKKWYGNYFHFQGTEWSIRTFACYLSCFSQSHKVGNVGIIANFVFTYICSFLLYLQQMISVNMKLEIKGYMGIIFQGQMPYWNSWFLMAELKQSWQCWHSCIAESLWKTFLYWQTSNPAIGQYLVCYTNSFWYVNPFGDKSIAFSCVYLALNSFMCNVPGKYMWYYCKTCF